MRNSMNLMPDDGVQDDIGMRERAHSSLQPGWLNLVAHGKRPQGEPTRTDMAIGGTLMAAAGLGVRAIALHARH